MVSEADFVLGAEEAFHKHRLEKHRAECNCNCATTMTETVSDDRNKR